MNEGISVRTCIPSDLDTLVSLGIKTFRDTFDDFNTPENMLLYINKKFARTAIEREMKAPGTTFFLAFDRKKAAGYAKIRTCDTTNGMVNSPSIEIERLYAHKDYIGKKVGYMLMQTCLAFAKKNRYQVLWLGVWENNERAIAFYRKNGFEKIGQHQFMLGNDAQTDWLMKKELTTEK